MHLIFIGYPGSGKGTVSKLLPQYQSISTGDLLRSEIKSGSKLGTEIGRIINNGNLVPDHMALELIKKRIKPLEQYIFDGFPRTLAQAKMLKDQILKNEQFKVIHFDISKDLLTERITNRRSCPSCGEIYNLKFKPPVSENTCDKCNHSGLTLRADDTIEVLQNRFKIYELESPSILEFFKDNLIAVDAAQPADEIIKKIKA